MNYALTSFGITWRALRFDSALPVDNAKPISRSARHVAHHRSELRRAVAGSDGRTPHFRACTAQRADSLFESRGQHAQVACLSLSERVPRV
jgi:hypothetical protein